MTLPWARRSLVSRRPELAKGVLRVAMRVLLRSYRDRAAVSGSDLIQLVACPRTTFGCRRVTGLGLLAAST